MFLVHWRHKGKKGCREVRCVYSDRKVLVFKPRGPQSPCYLGVHARCDVGNHSPGKGGNEWEKEAGRRRERMRKEEDRGVWIDEREERKWEEEGIKIESDWKGIGHWQTDRQWERQIDRQTNIWTAGENPGLRWGTAGRGDCIWFPYLFFWLSLQRHKNAVCIFFVSDAAK